MRKDKKIVDLIYLEDNKSEAELKLDYVTRIQTWLDWLEIKLDADKSIEESFVEEQTEYYMISNLLKNFIKARLDWILDSVKNSELRNKYLLALPPFSQMGNVKNFLFHFFQLHQEGDTQIVGFNFLNRSERELRILWDIYKISRTLESINVLQKSLSSEDPFPSRFKKQEIKETLHSLSSVLHLLLKICIKTEYHAKILTEFPLNILQADQILKRKEADEYLVNDIVLEKFDYRNYLFYIYFRTSLKAQYGDQEYVFRYNYLDYEIIRQEFLIHWIHKHLSNNSAKIEVFKRYKMGSRSFFEIILENPEMEISLLKQLPNDTFNDLIARINEAVDDDLQTPLDPMSEKIGHFAHQLINFEFAKNLAKKSIQSLKEFLLEMSQERKSSHPFKNVDQTKLKVRGLVHEYQITALKKKEIPYPYFVTNTANFKREFGLFQNKMDGEKGSSFNKSVGGYLKGLGENKLIKRRTPRHEWTRPFLITENIGNKSVDHLLILGAEVKTKRLGMGYASHSDQNFELKSYFIYGSIDLIPEMGTPQEERMVRGKSFHIYSFSNFHVIEKVMEFTEIILEQG